MRRVQFAVLVCAGASGSAAWGFAATPGGANKGNGFLQIDNIPNSITSPTSTGKYTVSTPVGLDEFADAYWFHRIITDTDTQPRELAYGNGASPTGVASSGFFVGDLTGNLDTGGMDYFTFHQSGVQTQSRQRYTMPANGVLLAQVNAVNVVTNGGTDIIDVHMFALLNLDIGGTPGDDVLLVTRDDAIIQNNVGGGPNGAARIAPLVGFRGATEFVAPVAFEASINGAIYASLTDNGVTTLSNQVADGPGDASIAFEWFVTLAPGESAAFGYQFGFIPAPGGAATFALAAVMTARRRR